MKSKILFSAILLLGLMVTNFSGTSVYGQSKQQKSTTMQKVKYTCPEHPEVVMDKPGKCPKCGMDLVEKKAAPAGTMKSMPESTTKHKHNKMMNDSLGTKKEPLKM
jgi:hypothetical protein